jgi:alpha-tubulin suppressor-like RCC1 family protein
VQEYNGDTDWTAVSAGNVHTVALKSDGTIWSWGSNGYGQLGDNTTTISSVPVQEYNGDTDWESISANRYNTLAIKSDGSVWGWGYNEYSKSLLKYIAYPISVYSR